MSFPNCLSGSGMVGPRRCPVISPFRACCLTLAFSCFCSGTVAATEKAIPDFSKLAKEARPSVFLLMVFDEHDKEVATATGFVVSKNGMLITNHHVIEGAKHIEAKAINGGRFTVTGVLADAPSSDLVVLRLDGNDFRPLALGKGQMVEVGNRVVVIGSPKGLEGTVSEGIVSAIRSDEKQGKILQMTAAISSGSSGSPVLNRAGKVIGVATSQLQGGQTLNFAVSVDVLLALMKQVDESKKVQTLEEIQPLISKKDAILNDPDRLSCESLIKDNKLSDALRVSQLLIDRYPADWRSFVLLGRIYFIMGLNSEAVTAAQQAIKLKFDSAISWGLLASAYNAIGKNAESLQAHEQVIRFDPALHRGVSLVVVGLSLCTQKKYKEATPLLEKFVSLFEGKEMPNDTYVFFALGGCYIENDKYDSTRLMIKKLYSLNTEESKTHAGVLEYRLEKNLKFGQ